MGKDEKLTEEMLSSWVLFEGIMRTTVMSGSLTHREFSVCNTIANAEGRITATELCDILKIHKSQMNRTLAKLEKEGVIIRERSQEDKRCVYVTLNPKGIAPYRDMHKKAADYTDAVIGIIGEERIKEIKQSFTEVVDAFDAMSNEKGEVNGKNN